MASVAYKQAGTYDGAGFAFGTTDDIYGDSYEVAAFAVIVDAETIADAKHIYISDEVGTGKTGGKGQSAGLSIDTSPSQSEGSWVPVPEPTSGLLLLLGVAGLALRRRRA